jgi:hypothetical protein
VVVQKLDTLVSFRTCVSRHSGLEPWLALAMLSHVFLP